MKLRNIVIKIGSAVISNDSGINSETVNNIVDNIQQLLEENTRVVLVSSGAVSRGITVLNNKYKPSTIPYKQALASIGQIFLMNSFIESFGRYGANISQILLTNDLLTNRTRYINAKNTMEVLLSWGIVPIINENDTVSVEELKFGDNDKLAAHVALLIDADLLLILSDVDGLYTGAPDSASSKKIDIVEKVDKKIYDCAKNTGSAMGTGGMRSKLKAAEIVTKSGIECIIAYGKCKNPITTALQNKTRGTRFLAQPRISSKKRWLAFTAKSRGTIEINAGAVKNIKEKGTSLLPVGVTQIKGNFKQNDVLDIIDGSGEIIGKGISFYSAAELAKIKGKHTNEIAAILGQVLYEEIIHRDNMVII